MLKNLGFKWVFCLGALLLVAFTAVQAETVAERIAPAGSVCVEGDADCGATVVADSGGAARSGADVYQTACFGCHGTGAMGAPKSQTSDWDSRNSQGLATLVANGINGIRAMPAKGGCAACSDDEIEAAVKYMSGL